MAGHSMHGDVIGKEAPQLPERADRAVRVAAGLDPEQGGVPRQQGPEAFQHLGFETLHVDLDGIHALDAERREIVGAVHDPGRPDLHQGAVILGADAEGPKTAVAILDAIEGRHRCGLSKPDLVQHHVCAVVELHIGEELVPQGRIGLEGVNGLEDLGEAQAVGAGVAADVEQDAPAIPWRA